MKIINTYEDWDSRIGNYRITSFMSETATRRLLNKRSGNVNCQHFWFKTCDFKYMANQDGAGVNKYNWEKEGEE